MPPGIRPHEGAAGDNAPAPPSQTAPLHPPPAIDNAVTVIADMFGIHGRPHFHGLVRQVDIDRFYHRRASRCCAAIAGRTASTSYLTSISRRSCSASGRENSCAEQTCPHAPHLILALGSSRSSPDSRSKTALPHLGHADTAVAWTIFFQVMRYGSRPAQNF